MDNRKEILAALDGIVGGDVDKLDLSKLKQTESTPEETKELDGKKKKSVRVCSEELWGNQSITTPHSWIPRQYPAKH